MSNMFSFAANFNVENSPVVELWVILITDGKLDIANTNCNSNTVSILLGNGSGMFRSIYFIMLVVTHIT
ncbi:MAG: hypothetical protein MRQ13_04810 [Candidatus Midichloria sp.]|nr:hypothetical protein [Candidatus Midichloria sp.]